MYEFTANDFNEVKTAVQQDIIAPSASALKHKLQVISFFQTFQIPKIQHTLLVFEAVASYSLVDKTRNVSQKVTVDLQSNVYVLQPMLLSLNYSTHYV